MSFLFVDRIIQSSPGEFIRGLKHVTSDDVYLNVDKEGRAYFIPSLIGETLGQLAAWNVMAHNNFSLRPVAGVVASVRLLRPAYVGETLILESFIDVLDSSAVQYHSLARIGDEPVFILDGALGPLLPMDHFIGTEAVQNQYKEIFRPGDWSSLSELSRSSMPVGINKVQASAPFPVLPLMTFDKILEAQPGEYLCAEKRITRSASYFPDHFPRKPVLPMTVLLECIQNLAQRFVNEAQFAEQHILSELRKIKMNEFVHPGDIVRCQLKMKQQTLQELILTTRCEVEGRRVCVVEVVFKVKGI